MFEGSIVALVTPIRNNAIDFCALEKLVEFHLNSGTDGILVCGSTGEGLLLIDEERENIISFVIKMAASRIKILVGCSSCSTSESIRLVLMAQELGADGVLVIAPYYIKPTQLGIIEHFKQIHTNSNIPIIVYNNPGRCSIGISLDTVFELSKLDRIVALKDSDTNLSRVTVMRSMVSEDFKLLSGDDLTLPGFLAHGGDGTISVVANLEPLVVKKLVESWKMGDIKTMVECDQKLAPLNRALSSESNPIPVKYALFRRGLIQNELRLPLLPASKATEMAMDKVLEI
ncbi:MAG: 4-hydroxy-tetrahydrodipicolinate synthase [Holosporales bacterium]|jgi:4-hydroxy-tetrahydrodipicolinate synthase|nr:4-hydroxy-tetrahydrodipicolinate synthase [Holosporales bacterium]